MDEWEREFLDDCFVLISDEVVLNERVKNMLEKKKIFTPEELQEIFQSENKDETLFELIRYLQAKKSSALTNFIDILKGIGQMKLGVEMEERRRSVRLARGLPDRDGSRQTVRVHGKKRKQVQFALNIEADVRRYVEGWVAVDGHWMAHIIKYGSCATDVIPGPLETLLGSGHELVCISPASADTLIAALGGSITVTVQRQNGGLVLCEGPKLRRVNIKFINQSALREKTGRWMIPSHKIRQSIFEFFEAEPTKVMDYKGYAVPLDVDWVTWWCDAPTLDGEKQVHVWF